MTRPRTIQPSFQLATLKAAAWLVSITLALSAQAATGTNEAMQCDNPPPVGKHLEQLHKDLDLDSAQESQWKNALATTNTLRQEMQEARHAAHDQVKAELNTPAPNLRAVAARLDKQRDEQQKKRQQARETWLAFYDGLKPAQKEKASHFLLHQIAMLGEFAPGMMQDRHDPKRHGRAEAPDAQRR